MCAESHYAARRRFTGKARRPEAPASVSGASLAGPPRRSAEDGGDGLITAGRQQRDDIGQNGRAPDGAAQVGPGGDVDPDAAGGRRVRHRQVRQARLRKSP
ncbi:MAG: hypothetical protein NVS3B26_05440 [Mycobacteriales bacterium]